MLTFYNNSLKRKKYLGSEILFHMAGFHLMQTKVCLTGFLCSQEALQAPPAGGYFFLGKTGKTMR